MRTEHLEYLIEIADSGSITTTAEKFHISQPSISQSLSKLEEELQTKIFNRSRTGTYPTETGKLIIQQAREIILQVKKLEEISNTQSPAVTGSLTVSVVPSFSNSILPSILSVYKNQFPDVQIKVIENGSIKVIEDVAAGNVDFGLAAFFETVEFDNNLVFEPLLVGNAKACVGNSSEFAQRREITLQEIVRYPIITFSQEYKMNSFILNFLRQYGKPNLLFTAGNSAAAKVFISQGLALGFFSDISLKRDPYVLSGEIIPLNIQNPQTKSYFGVIYRKDTDFSVSSKEFLKELRIQAKKFIRHFNLADPNSTRV